MSSLAAQTIMQLEVQEELSSWRPNLALLAALCRLGAQEIEIVVYSDTYLPHTLIRSWLDCHLPFATLFCSSETLYTKRSGRAFRFLRNRYPTKKLMHVGDDLWSDGIMPMKNDIDAAILEGRGRFSSTLPAEVSSLARLRGLRMFPAFFEAKFKQG